MDCFIGIRFCASYLDANVSSFPYIFVIVFKDFNTRIGSKLDTLLKRNMEYFDKLSSALKFESTYSEKLNIDITPRLCRNVLVEILKESSIPYIACEREADITVAELAIYLRCPVTSGDSDFFIYRPNDHNQVYSFIPFSSISLDL
ncbi:hypothetical protein Smp_084440 [Schistosoma mansoni]|uniref:hypothetical protein n=1 Tax=Schistosoma mansoni TaxID=6183 RepID=UPI00022DC9B6|nr:hypothetical protein Smp_084440 [Schistosoma mansoni]|eukprot:XP_018654423.1 hypothetical protein Smp_084440 [Schistosoma mansoni]